MSSSSKVWEVLLVRLSEGEIIYSSIVQPTLLFMTSISSYEREVKLSGGFVRLEGTVTAWS